MLYRRKDSRYWWIKIEVNGRRIQRSAGTDSKTKAQEYHDKIKAELWNQSKLKEKPNYIWQEAAIKWLQESSHKKSIADDKMHLRILDDYLRDKTLQSVSRQEYDGAEGWEFAKPFLLPSEQKPISRLVVSEDEIGWKTLEEIN